MKWIRMHRILLHSTPGIYRKHHISCCTCKFSHLLWTEETQKTTNMVILEYLHVNLVRRTCILVWVNDELNFINMIANSYVYQCLYGIILEIYILLWIFENLTWLIISVLCGALLKKNNSLFLSWSCLSRDMLNLFKSSFYIHKSNAQHKVKG